MKFEKPANIGTSQLTQPKDTTDICLDPDILDPADTTQMSTKSRTKIQRIIFIGIVVLLNICMAIAAILGKESKLALIAILFVKSKDFLSTIVSILGMLIQKGQSFFRPPKLVPPLWILSLIPAYSESEEQIVKTIFSLRDNGIKPHRQVIVVILDGKSRDVRSQMTRITCEIERPYISFKAKRGVLRIKAGFMMDVPVMVIEKVRNAGKKDSLILCHDLFNYPRHNSPLYTQLLRKELWERVLPVLTESGSFKGFDMVFCTDADSRVHKGAVVQLAEAVARDGNAIAACGLVLVELEPGYEWSFWNLYQQFQVSDNSLLITPVARAERAEDGMLTPGSMPSGSMFEEERKALWAKSPACQDASQWSQSEKKWQGQSENMPSR
ncbi:chitin synthase 7 [Colletotrichum tofieldiae]|nr:chitin synthase 7 [Colletotrichum tofieldiae]GKT70091.1 chitin synthase 7 [Colletotrichum tofieldiae]